MKNSLKTLIAVVAIAATSSASAIMIEGQINIGASNGTVATVDQVGNTVSFTNSGQSQVNFVSGSYVGLLNAAATYSNFSYDTLAPQTVWSIDATTYFVLETITFVSEANRGAVLSGIGTAYLAGFTPSAGSWTFSADGIVGNTFSFSSTTQSPPARVADSGSSLALLGLGILGLAAVARRFKK